MGAEKERVGAGRCRGHRKGGGQGHHSQTSSFTHSFNRLVLSTCCVQINGRALDAKAIKIASLPCEPGFHTCTGPPGGQLAGFWLSCPSNAFFLPGEPSSFGTRTWRIIFLKNLL